VNAVSKRVKQLSQGDRPLVDAGIRAGFADIAFMEIAEGKLTLEMPPEEVMPVA
jgi:DNA-directed RNA polymerase subunit K/omega